MVYPYFYHGFVLDCYQTVENGFEIFVEMQLLQQILFGLPF